MHLYHLFSPAKATFTNKHKTAIITLAGKGSKEHLEYIKYFYDLNTWDDEAFQKGIPVQKEVTVDEDSNSPSCQKHPRCLRSSCRAEGTDLF